MIKPGIEKDQPSALLKIAGVQRRQGEYDSAINTLRGSLAIGLDIGARNETQDAFLEISEVYVAVGRYQEALEAFRRYESIKSEIFNDENSKTVADMQARFESDRRAEELEMLNQQQTIGALKIARQETERTALLGGLLLLLLVIVVLYNRYRLKVRSSHLIELQQRELVTKERLAVLGQLTATVSHELRNPLGAMRPALYVLRKRSNFEDPRVAKALTRLERGISRCDRIIEELLDSTRAGTLDLRTTPVDEWLAALLDELTVPSGITVHRELGLPGVRLPFDSSRLRRAVINVYDNACQAMIPAEDLVPAAAGTRLLCPFGKRAQRANLLTIATLGGVG